MNGVYHDNVERKKGSKTNNKTMRDGSLEGEGSAELKTSLDNETRHDKSTGVQENDVQVSIDILEGTSKSQQILLRMDGSCLALLNLVASATRH
jgi:hypothetical protein